MTTATDLATDTFFLEVKPGPDPLRRQGIDREPIYRLKRLLKFAARECGLRIRWGRAAAPVELSEEDLEHTMIRLTNGPAADHLLHLRRAPLYLRVCYNTLTRQWDALDQLADRPQPAESIFVYRRVGEPSYACIDWTEKGRRRGARMACASYELVETQPDDATLRDTQAWRAWCWSQVQPKPEAIK